MSWNVTATNEQYSMILHLVLLTALARGLNEQVPSVSENSLSSERRGSFFGGSLLCTCLLCTTKREMDF